MRALAALLIALTALFAAAPALADAADGEPQYVDVGPVALPIVDQGKLRNYVFVTVRLHLIGGVDAETWRDKEPYFRDALVRAGHRTPFVLPHDWMKVDQETLKRVMLAEAIRIAGRNIFTSVEVTRVTPQRWVKAPSP